VIDRIPIRVRTFPEQYGSTADHLDNLIQRSWHFAKVNASHFIRDALLIGGFLLGLTVLASCNGLFFPWERATAVHNCLKEIFDSMPKRFNKEAAKGVNAVVQYNLKGDGGGKWCVTIKNDNCEVMERACRTLPGQSDPDIIISTAAHDYLDIIGGKANGQMMFMTGKLNIAGGDLGLGLRMQSLFREVATNSCSRL
jgi:putative sterol carrier protein